MPTTNEDWIALRLPPGASFTRNGVTLTVSDAIYAALEDNDDDKYLALADLLEILLGAMEYESETIGDYTYRKSSLTTSIAFWRNRSADESDTGEVGAFES